MSPISASTGLSSVDAGPDILPAEGSCRPSRPSPACLPPAELLPCKPHTNDHWPQLQAKQPLQSLSPEKRPAPLVSPFQGAAGGRAHSAYSTERHSGRAGPAAQAEAGVAPQPLTLEEVPEGRPGAGLEAACSSPSRVGIKLQHLKQRQQVGRGTMSSPGSSQGAVSQLRSCLSDCLRRACWRGPCWLRDLVLPP